MTLKELRERLAQIKAETDAFEGIEDFETEQVEKINALSEEYNQITNKISALEKIDEIKAKSETSNRKVLPASTTPSVEVKASLKEKQGGFNSMGEFLSAVRTASTGKMDPRFSNAAFEKSGEDGGFLVPETFMSEVTRKLQADDSLLARTRQFTTTSNSLTLPVDETAPWSGGAKAYWMGEGKSYTESKVAVGQASFRLHKLGVMTVVTDELLEDAVAMESYVRMSAPTAIQQAINEAIISGNGVAKPAGLLSSGFKVQVSAEGGQTADTVVTKNVIKMYSRLIPQSRGNAVWLINPAVEEQLRLMKDDNNNFLYVQGGNLAASPYGLLMGRPVLPMLGSMPQLGDEGDIVLCDLSYYYSVMKSGGIKAAQSAHLYFDKDMQAFKWTLRIDGGCPFKAPVNPQFGTFPMSAFVTLAAR
jgi:HK97 family phage major capsid protein